MTHISPIIGYHRSPLSQKFGVPRQPNLVATTSLIEMIAPYDVPAAFVGLEDFSHIWVSWQSHHHRPEHEPEFRAQVRPPRLGGNQKVGVFASRSMYRPSGVGLSVVKLERVDSLQGRVMLRIAGADMIDGTAIIDIKPYIAYSDALSDAVSGFAPIAPIPLAVEISAQAQQQLAQLIAADHSDELADGLCDRQALIDRVQSRLLPTDVDIIQALIAQDPRPAYRCQEVDQHFVMRYKSVDVVFLQRQLGQLSIIEVWRIDRTA